jgi:hypothetical protein
MDQKRKEALTPGAEGNQGVGSVAVLGEGDLRDGVLKAYMREYRMVAEEGSK